MEEERSGLYQLLSTIDTWKTDFSLVTINSLTMFQLLLSVYNHEDLSQRLTL